MIEIEQYLQAGDIELRAKDIKTLLDEHNNMKKEIQRLKEEYMILQNASDEVEEEKDREIERLKQGYCELKEKCNKGECDCTHEEYNNMCEENIKMDLEIERLNNDIKILLKENDNKEKVIKAQDNIINKAIHRIQLIQMDGEVTIRDLTKLVNILKGSDKE